MDQEQCLEWKNQLFHTEQQEEPFYTAAVVDQILFEEAVFLLHEEHTEWAILNPGGIRDARINALPLLVRLEYESFFTDRLISEFGKGCAVFLRVKGSPAKSGGFSADMGKLYAHLKMCSFALLPGQINAWFRYYDPVVMRCLMKVGDPDQKNRFFGPDIDAIFAENPLKERIEVFQRECDFNASNYNINKSITISIDQYEKFAEFSFKFLVGSICQKLHLTQYSGASAQQLKELNVDVENSIFYLLEKGITDRDRIERFIRESAHSKYVSIDSKMLLSHLDGLA